MMTSQVRTAERRGTLRLGRSEQRWQFPCAVSNPDIEKVHKFENK